jgi:hypothetical protein
LKILFLYSEDCPSHEQALQRLRKVMNEEGMRNEIEILRVETSEEAEKLKFIGSPTILIDGRDIDPPTNPYYALTCRAYRLEDGRISPLPSEAMIRQAIRRASTEES